MTLADRLLAVVGALPDSASVTMPVAELRRWLDGIPTEVAATAIPVTWRERLWTCPPDTRLVVRDLAEALGRPRSWVYRAVAVGRGAHRLPARRLHGELIFEAGEVRSWLEKEETSHS